ncbi:MAG: hypothetical protein ACQEQ4_01470 [Fibrobacterota bacterium]
MHLILLYPETHFRFKKISPSLLFKKEPEIIFDMPRRCAPDTTPEVFLIINDADIYPAVLHTISLHIQSATARFSITVDSPASYEIHHEGTQKTLAYAFPLTEARGLTGLVRVSPVLICSIAGRKHTIVTDNLTTSKKEDLTYYAAQSTFPGNAIYGDLHCHSIHSRSHVEFGAPLPMIHRALGITGLDTAAVLDHTYDLECDAHNYLKRDPLQSNWKNQQKNRTLYPRLIVSQEISARKKHGGVVHVGFLGESKLIRGSGDGARKGYRKAAEETLESLCKIYAHTGILFAAHPGEKPGILQRIFLRRGKWTIDDFRHNRLHAFQIVNGSMDSSWIQSRKLWIKLLLSQIPLPIIAGNDAHGDFNRYRALHCPFFLIREDKNRYFGYARTGVYDTQHHSFISAVKAGQTFVTTGPYLCLHTEKKILIQTKPLRISHICVTAKSSPEFGILKKLIIFTGVYGKRERKTLLALPQTSYTFTGSVPLNTVPRPDYIRAEVYTDCGENRREGMAATSPAYFLHNKKKSVHSGCKDI